MRLCFSASSAVARDFAPSAASIGAVSMSRMSLPMYCRWRARPPRAGDALGEQDGVEQLLGEIQRRAARIP